MEHISLFDLNEHIRRVLALNFPEALWVSCEIGQLNESQGHYFFSLVQKAEEHDHIIAQAEGVLWRNGFRQLQRRIGGALRPLLQEGIEVLLQVKVDFHERYGLKLIIEDIDPAYTLGRLEQQRREILERLRAESLLRKNARVSLPAVLQRIAVISSERAAGYQDYLHQLEVNPNGYRFLNQFFPSAMQGQHVESEMLQQLKRIGRQKAQFDCLVIIRGGGARLDLAAFDNYALGKAIAECPLPVLTGIGHDIDETVVDMTAHTALKTPTATADFLINRNLQFEAHMEDLSHRLQLDSQRLLRRHALQLEQLEQQLHYGSRRTLTEQERLLDYIDREWPRLARRSLKDQHQSLEQQERLLQLLSPEATLRRGYTMTLKGGRPVTSANELQAGDRISTRFIDGERQSRIQNDDQT